jgi:hypothetical protein
MCYDYRMGRLFKGIKSLIAILEIAGVLLSAIFFILNKIGIIKNMTKKTPPSRKTDKREL